MITCKNCNTAYNVDYKFCPTCGKASDRVTCPSCFALIPADSDYCPKCSNPVTNTERCGHCGGMNAKSAKFCSVCGKSLKSQYEIATDVARIKAVIPMLRNALEEREQPAPVLSKKELKAKKKMEKIARKAGFTIVDPEDENVVVTADDLLASIDAPEAAPAVEHQCTCGNHANEDYSPIFNALRKQNENLELVLNKLTEKAAQPAAQPAAPQQPCYPFPFPYPMPMYCQQPVATQAPAQPIVIQQPAAQAPAQPIVIQQPSAQSPMVVKPSETEHTIIINSDGKAVQEAEAKPEKKKKRRLASTLMLLSSVAYLAMLFAFSFVFVPNIQSAIVPGAHGIFGMASAFLSAFGLPVLGGENAEALAAVVQGLTLNGTFDRMAATVVNYIVFVISTLLIICTLWDVLVNLLRVITGKAKKGNTRMIKAALIYHVALVLIVAIVSVFDGSNAVNSLMQVFTSFLNVNATPEVRVLGLGAIVGLVILIVRIIIGLFVKKPKQAKK